MIKLVYCLRKRADISKEEFHRYWLEEHGPLVRSHVTALGALRYVQSHTFESELGDALTGSRGASPPHDGLAELWWSDVESLQAAMGTDKGVEAGRDLLEDEGRFIDFAASTIFLTEEHEIFQQE